MKKIKFILPILALFVLFSCDDYLGDNTSPNNPSPDQVTPDLQLAVAETSSFREINRNMNRLGNFLMNNWGINVNSYAATNPREFSMQFTNNDYTSIWDNTYLYTKNLSDIINHPAANYENHKAIAKILKSFYFQYMVDLYGDIPYFEIHQGTENMTPVYDDAQTVYNALYDQLTEAIDMIDNPNPDAHAVGTEDAIFAGNMQNWKKFANTVKLRMLLRQSNNAALATYVSDKFTNDLAGASFLDQNAVLNPGYNDSTAESQNPFYAQMYDVAGNELGLHRYARASKYMGDLLNGTADPRGPRIFTLVGGAIQGVIQGDESQPDGTAPLDISAIGTGLAPVPVDGDASVGSSQDAYVMTLAESLLLQAEAAHKGFIVGTAQTLFDDAITASYGLLGVTDGGYIGYINTIPGKGYTVGTSDQQIEGIMYQKNIVMQAACNAMEAFIEYTRTGLIDNIPMATGALKPNKPRRMLYPNSEHAGNSANVPSQGDVFTTGSFWYN